MLRFALVMVMVFAFSKGQDEAFFRTIYNDMDLNGTEAVTQTNVYSFFLSMTPPGSNPGDGLTFFDFDYHYGNWYSEGRQTTLYLFDKWDINNNDVLDAEDLSTLFVTVDIQGPPYSSPDWWHFKTEFLGYMTNLYAGAPAERRRRK